MAEGVIVRLVGIECIGVQYEGSQRACWQPPLTYMGAHNAQISFSVQSDNMKAGLWDVELRKCS